MTYRYCILSAIFVMAGSLRSQGQVTLGGQIRTRTEFKNGAGTLRLRTSDPFFFVSQRSRLSVGYKQSRVNFHTEIQDVRIWGQDASTISSNDGARLGIQEAWAEVILTNKKDGVRKNNSPEYASIKTGRQALHYDDGRLLGDHDWSQQGRRHDILVFKLMNKGWQTDAGLAFNRNTDAYNYNGNYYTPANIPASIRDSRGFLVTTPAGYLPLADNTGTSSRAGRPLVVNPASTNGLLQLYKSMQYFYAGKTSGDTKWSTLLVADHFGKNKLDSVQTSLVNNQPGYVYGLRYNQKGTTGRYTMGMQFSTKTGKKKQWAMQAGAYYQGGKDPNAKKLSAAMAYGNLRYSAGKFSAGAGIDYLSGNDAFSSSTVSHRFDPLYGSPHENWGAMDFFYANSGSAAGGLVNPYVQFQYTSENKRLALFLKGHHFRLAGSLKDNNGIKLNDYLGTELDATLVYSLNKITTLEWGGSLMAAGATMEYAKGITPGSSLRNGQWTYLQLTIKPEFILK